MLSPADREYLLSSEQDREESYSRQAQTKREKAVLERAENAIMDFALLQEHLDGEGRAEIFEDKPVDMDRGVHGMVAFLWQYASDPPSYDPDGEPLISPENRLEEWLERGIHRAQTTMPPGIAGNIEIRPVDVDLEIQSLEELDVEDVEHTVRTKGVEALTESELLFLLWLGRRGDVADMDFISETDIEAVIAELTDRIGDGWGLRGQVILDPRAYDDDIARAKRTERREECHDTIDEDHSDAAVGGDPWKEKYDDE